MVNVTKIRQLAKEKGITLTHLCSLCGKPRWWINDISNKHLDMPEDKLQIIANALGTTTDYLRDKSEQKTKPPLQDFCILANIIEELKKQQKTQKQLCEYLGLTQNSFTEWKSGRGTSYKKYLPQIAKYLGVSVDHLLGNSEHSTQNLSDEQVTLLLNYAALTDEQKTAVNVVIKQFLNRD